MPHIRLSKIGIPESPLVSPGNWSTYREGEANSASLPLGYWLEGDLVAPIRVGDRVTVRRTNRNGKNVAGLFVSSAVVVYDGLRLETANSIYRVEVLRPLRIRDLPEGEREPFTRFLTEHRCTCPVLPNEPHADQDGYNVGDYAAWRAGAPAPDELDMSGE